LQLDQLRLAPASPTGTSVEDKERPSIASLFVQIDFVTMLVGQRDIRKP
jgi:hypothetical protein